MKLSTTLKPKLKGAFYARYSTAKQNINTQRKMCEEIVNKYKCFITHEYLDENCSAVNKKLIERPKISSLLKDIEQKEFDFIIVYQQDRLARDPLEHLFIRNKLAEQNIPVIVASTEQIYDSGDIMINIFRDGLSQYEVETLRQRTKDTMASLNINGQWTGGVAPLGYQYNKKSKKIELHPFERQLVMKMFQLFREGDGIQTIANDLNTTFKLPNRQFNKKINKQLVKRTLLNPIYAGYLVHHRHLPFEQWRFNKASSNVQPLMTLEQWKTIYALYESKKNNRNHLTTVDTNFIVNHLMICHSCNTPLSVKNQLKENKNTGAIYGRCWYKCVNCRYKLDNIAIDTQCALLLKKISTQYYAGYKHSLTITIEEKCKEIDNQINHIEQMINHKALMIQNSKQEREKLISMKEFSEDDGDLILLLKQYEVEAENQILEIKAEIEVLSRSKQRFGNLELQDEMKNIVQKLSPNDYLRDRVLMKKMLTHLIDKIYIAVSAISKTGIPGKADLIINLKTK